MCAPRRGRAREGRGERGARSHDSSDSCVRVLLDAGCCGVRCVRKRWSMCVLSQRSWLLCGSMCRCAGSPYTHMKDSPSTPHTGGGHAGTEQRRSHGRSWHGLSQTCLRWIARMLPRASVYVVETLSTRTSDRAARGRGREASRLEPQFGLLTPRPPPPRRAVRSRAWTSRWRPRTASRWGRGRGSCTGARASQSP